MSHRRLSIIAAMAAALSGGAFGLRGLVHDLQDPESEPKPNKNPKSHPYGISNNADDVRRQREDRKAAQKLRVLMRRSDNNRKDPT
jgi:hypothetical protein